MAITSCDHTGITVTDIERSLAFWTSIMGCKLLYRVRSPPHEIADQIMGVRGVEMLVAMLEAPGGYHIELLQYLAPAGREHFRPRPCDVGSVHLAFTVDNIAEMLDGLLAAGCVVNGKAGGAPDSDVLYLYLHDFDGVTIELVQQPKRTE
ncbi:glyoxalase/bleomycin resistance protein/dioxygenase [Mycena belliarum]|uniref:Glyoxalase/bleomycin resistance protein/dioxygenase n=1 Tax=Mycena belliarum TaxID=1033014 RepID=A0AAD6U398_9AGAR|nr:glyoxalase/bleomycin resistance protein/dioxygenase [Mycena belliae]